MNHRTTITTSNRKKINADTVFYAGRIRKLENQVQKLKAWILRNMDPGKLSGPEKMELYRLLTL